jgi:hypothetical protein
MCGKACWNLWNIVSWRVWKERERGKVRGENLAIEKRNEELGDNMKGFCPHTT